MMMMTMTMAMIMTTPTQPDGDRDRHGGTEHRQTERQTASQTVGQTERETEHRQSRPSRDISEKATTAHAVRVGNRRQAQPSWGRSHLMWQSRNVVPLPTLIHTNIYVHRIHSLWQSESVAYQTVWRCWSPRRARSHSVSRRSDWDALLLLLVLLARSRSVWTTATTLQTSSSTTTTTTTTTQSVADRDYRKLEIYSLEKVDFSSLWFLFCSYFCCPCLLLFFLASFLAFCFYFNLPLLVLFLLMLFWVPLGIYAVEKWDAKMPTKIMLTQATVAAAAAVLAANPTFNILQHLQRTPLRNVTVPPRNILPF